MKPTIYLLPTDPSRADAYILADTTPPETAITDTSPEKFILISTGISHSPDAGVQWRWQQGDPLPDNLDVEQIKVGLRIPGRKVRHLVAPVFFIQEAVVPSGPAVTYLVRTRSHYVGVFSSLSIAFGVCAGIIASRGGWLLDEILPRPS